MTMTATLVTDGASDVVLLPILRWLFGELTPEPVELSWEIYAGCQARPRRSGSGSVARSISTLASCFWYTGMQRTALPRSASTR